MASGVRAQQLITHPAVPQDRISRNDARLIFTMRLNRWPDGRRVRVFVLADDQPLHREFCKLRLGLFAHQLRRVWDRLLYSGTGVQPEVVPSLSEMHRVIATTPGAVGYLSEEMLDDRVKILAVE